MAEAACIPSPDPVRLSVPKAFVVLKPGWDPSAETARAILAFARGRLSPFQRIRRLEFAALPKTISGKIRRVELRALEIERRRDRDPGSRRVLGGRACVGGRRERTLGADVEPESTVYDVEC